MNPRHLIPLLLAPLLLMSASAESGHVRQPLPSPEEIAKLPADGGEEFNRLIFEPSPYLQQHARNPIDWYPWGEEAFAKAVAEGKPIFLSIGYTTCHWCHVMEHESFEDEEVAKVMNENYVAIKVDREERPDIDEVYMSFTMAMTGSGGWPMSVIMTPDTKKPFFAGTYFPKTDMPGRPGLISILTRIGQLWDEEQDKVVSEADRVTEVIRQHLDTKVGEMPGEAEFKKAFDYFTQSYDADYAGFGTSPKFPVPPNISYLLRFHHRTGEDKALEMASRTLKEMRKGGMYDQVGFGTHRYSTDRKWLLPHFEKMLYDQALIAIANLEAYQITQDEFFANTVREIFTYVLRDMTSKTGGFYSAEDADSEGEEGKFYVWRPEQVIEIAGDEEGKLFNRIYNITEEGNFIEEATREATGTSIPHLTKTIEEWAVELKEDAPVLRARLDATREKLYAHREGRIHPQKDDKILTDWNGLMIAAFAKGAQILDSEEYRNAAVKAADFVLETLRTEDGRLLKRYRLGEAGLTAHLEDYAFMTWGLLELYETTFETRYLKEAIALTEETIEHFWDGEEGGFYMTAEDSEELLLRTKKLYGGAIPSGNAVSALNLIRLYRMTGEETFQSHFVDLLEAFGGELNQNPSQFPMVMQAIDFHMGPSKEIVIAGDPEAADTQAMLSALRKPFLPNKVVLLRPPGDDPEIAKLAEYTRTQVARGGAATAYVCENFACQLPTTDITKMREHLGLSED